MMMVTMMMPPGDDGDDNDDDDDGDGGGGGHWVTGLGFFPPKPVSSGQNGKKLDKTCFGQFLPSKTVQSRPKLDEIMDSLVEMVISLN